MQKDNYSLLIEKLDAFIRKFYINHLLRGALYTVGTILGLFILLNILEYYFYFPTGVRTGMLWGYGIVSAAALWNWVAVPLMHYFRLGKVISHEQAAMIIGEHFTDVKDKLLNILQLREQSNNAIYAELINASINQKSEEIKLVPFQTAIDLGNNRKHLRWALPPLALLLFLMQCAPGIIREGSTRLWNANVEYERPAPFKFMVNPDSLRTVQFSDYVLRVNVNGNSLPNEVFIDLGKVQYRLTKEAPNVFSYKFANVQKDTDFKLFGGGVESRNLRLEVLEKPSIASFDVKLNYPGYTGRSTESLSNVGDLVVPNGTQISWTFDAKSTDQMAVRFGNDGDAAAQRFDDDLFAFSRRALRDEMYKVFISNQFLPNADSVAYTIAVIPDLHPQISVEEFRDSTNNRQVFFAGDAVDDYGLLNLTFNYQIKKAKGGQQPMATVKVDKSAGKQATYQYTWEIGNIALEPGDEVNYYFEVFDNDAVNGSKSARTQVMQYRLPTLNEMRQDQAANSEELKKNLEKALKESLKVQEEIKKLRDKVLQKKELDWQSRKEMERLMNRQQDLQQEIEQAKMSFDENKAQQQQMNQQSEQLMQKQEQLEKMFDEVLSDEMKQLMEDIQKMLEEMNKDEALEQMEEMQLSNEELNKELDRLQEMYKQLEVEQKLEDQINRLEELAKEQDKLAEDTQNSDKPQEELEKKQEELNKEMEDVAKEQEELQKKNEELERPQKVEDMKKEMEETQEEMDGASQEMDSGSKSGDQKSGNEKASKKQKKAAGKMKNMANQMKSAKKSGDMEQMEEDLATIRQLLENLVGLSFAQEQTMKEIATVNPAAPRYVQLTQQQYKIKDDFRLVEDSLQALAKRQFAIEGVITEKVTEIKGAVKSTLAQLEERNTGIANGHQQYAMKNLNDLALLLAEAMQNMQQQMAGGMPGNQSCQKPGNSGQGKGKKPSDKMSKGQGELGESLEQMAERMKKGKLPSKQFAQMAAKQAALRNALRDMQKQKQEQGKGNKALDEIMEQMEEIETDLVNKRLTNETLKRQQNIMTRLLEEERAERQQDEDEKRQAQTAQEQPSKMPPALEEYLKKRRAEKKQFRTVSPSLKPYYKGLVEEYLKGK